MLHGTCLASLVLWNDQSPRLGPQNTPLAVVLCGSVLRRGWQEKMAEKSQSVSAEPDSSHLGLRHLRALVEASKILNSTLDLDQLLGIILDVAKNELQADRGTVYLVHKPSGEIRARISQGMESRILRVKIGEGIAGKVAETGETIRIEDAYQDPRFAQRFDLLSGYRTRSILCMPICNKTGEIIGVIQLLNKINEGVFDLGDEIFLKALTVHIAIALENAKLHIEVVDQQRIRTELGLARQIQQNLLRPPPERWKRYRMAARADTCYEVGGDFYDFMPVSDSTMWVVIADVSGKGIASALVMSTLQATLRALLVGVHSFERLLERLNVTIRDFTGGTKYLTLFLALLDSQSHRVHYINAGHNPPVLVRADGRSELLDEGGTVLGLLPTVKFTRAHTELHPGDVLVLYTDGIAEASDAADEMYGVEGLVASVEAVRGDVVPANVLERIMGDVHKFSGGAPLADDQTLIVISPDN
jgi:sigma-B regulation protein RsbU (phosphoserine phosphatase)